VSESTGLSNLQNDNNNDSSSDYDAENNDNNHVTSSTTSTTTTALTTTTTRKTPNRTYSNIKQPNNWHKATATSISCLLQNLMVGSWWCSIWSVWSVVNNCHLPSTVPGRHQQKESKDRAMCLDSGLQTSRWEWWWPYYQGACQRMVVTSMSDQFRVEPNYRWSNLTANRKNTWAPYDIDIWWYMGPLAGGL
jgi:hypothetical protein